MIHLSNPDGPIVIISKKIEYTFPFGYGYIAGYLKEKGENVIVEFRPDSQLHYPAFIDRIVRTHRPMLIGFGSIYPDLYHTKTLISELKKIDNNIPAVVGGQMVSPTPDFALAITGADFGVISEGEIIFHQLIQTIRRHLDPATVKGIVLRTSAGRIFNTGPGEYIEDMAELPPVPYELFPEEQWLYISKFYTSYADTFLAPMYRYRDRIVAIHGGRGCPYTCNFCYHHNVARYRPLEDMFREAEILVKRYDANMIEFNDDLVVATVKRAEEMISRMHNLREKTGRNIEFSLSSRFNIIAKMSDQLLRDLKAAGCRIIGIGLESGSQAVLDRMNKKITVKQIETGLRRLRDANIIPIVAFMVGQIDETHEEVQESIDLLRRLTRDNPYFVSQFTIATPYPGSKLYDVCFERDLLKSHEDFFNLYDPYVELGGVTVNLSKMSDAEVLFYRNEMEKIHMEGKKLAADRQFLKIETRRARLKRIENYICLGINRATPSISLSRRMTNIINHIFDLIQIHLDKKRDIYLKECIPSSATKTQP